jgi:hypothetical protein
MYAIQAPYFPLPDGMDQKCLKFRDLQVADFAEKVDEFFEALGGVGTMRSPATGGKAHTTSCRCSCQCVQFNVSLHFALHQSL